MHPPENMKRIVDGKRYSVKTATLIASNEYWDGHNWERSGTNTFLYRTPNGRYFMVYLTQWQGDKDRLTPIIQEEAVEMYENSLTEHIVEYEQAFPGVEVEEA